MTPEFLIVALISFCLIIGAIFILIGAIGLLKFNDPMERMHAPTKVGTLGVGALLIGSMLHSAFLGDGLSIHEILIMAFLFVTAPISANFMAKVHLHQRTCLTPPPPSEDVTWSTLKAPRDRVPPMK